jgi:hypothetical protein
MADFIVVMDDAAVDLFESDCGEEISSIIGPIIKKGARRRALVRTGKLLDSIDWSHQTGPGGGFTEVHAVWYDLFQERPAKQIHHATRALIDAMNEDVPKLL